MQPKFSFQWDFVGGHTWIKAPLKKAGHQHLSIFVNIYIYIYMLIAHFAVLAELKMVRRILLPVLVELIQSNPSYPLKKELPIEIWD